MFRKISLSLLLFLSCSLYVVNAQDSLLAILDREYNEPIKYTYATFKSTRVVTSHSVESMKARQLDFRISHRFGRINSGAYEFFGLDQSNIHFGLEYGLTDRFMLAIGRSSYEKTGDAFYKWILLRQCTGDRIMPVSVSLLGGLAVNGMKPPSEELNWYFSNRLSYVHQLMIARKFTESFSLQLTPTFIHRNLVKTEVDPNDLFAAGIGIRYKLTRRISVNAEYFYTIRPGKDITDTDLTNPLSLGFDIETGGHVFQIHLTNSLGMIEKAYIGESTGSWQHGDIHLGFNISRVFSFK